MFTINYDKILNDKESPAVLKDLVREVQKRGAIHVGEWIRNLSTPDIWYLHMSADQFFNDIKNRRGLNRKPGDPPLSLSNVMIVLTDVLACAESTNSSNVDDVIPRIELLSNYISAEFLSRRGVKVKIHYNNMTLDLSDCDDKKIIEMDDLVNYVSDKMNLDEGHQNILKKLKDMAEPGSQIPDEEIRALYQEFLQIYDPNNKSSVIIRNNLEALMDSTGISKVPEDFPDFGDKVRSLDISEDKSNATMILEYDPDRDGPLDEFVKKNAEKFAKYMGGDGQLNIREYGSGEPVSTGQFKFEKGALQKSTEQTEQTEKPEQELEPSTKKGLFSALKDFIKDYRKSNPGSAAKS